MTPSGFTQSADRGREGRAGQGRGGEEQHGLCANVCHCTSAASQATSSHDLAPRMQMLYTQQYLSFLEGLLQDVVDVLVNLVQLVLLDVALLQQTLGILLVGVLMRPDCLHTRVLLSWSGSSVLGIHIVGVLVRPDRLHTWVLSHGQEVAYWAYTLWESLCALIACIHGF